MADRDDGSALEEHAAFALVERSFQRLLPDAELCAELFYGRLFLLDPSLRPLFRGDLREQGRRLMAVLRLAVGSLDRIEAIVPALEALGRRHAGYGVREAHYATARSALLWALEHTLGDDLTPAAAAAWGRVYDLLAGVMKEAARAALDAPPPSRTAPPSRPSSDRAPVSHPL